MSRASYWRGHLIRFEDGRWIYADNLLDVAGNGERPCGYCGKMNTEDGHDGCIGRLGGVMNACCGHGDISVAYIQYSDGHTVRGADTRHAFLEAGQRGEVE